MARMTPELSVEQRDALRAARRSDGIAAQPRVRALIAIWRDAGSTSLRRRVTDMAREDAASIERGVRRYPVRLSVVLADEDHAALMDARDNEVVDAAAVVRSLVRLWMEDPDLQTRARAVVLVRRSRS
jgi:hypothetical protein